MLWRPGPSDRVCLFAHCFPWGASEPVREDSSDSRHNRAMSKPFLTAEWRNLALANYAVDPGLLAEHVPAGVELDQHEGKCFVSLVGFQFSNTKVRGVAIPGHVNFVEVNLRFYVRLGEKRGVVFLKEIVPKPAIAWVAKTLYGEPYEVWKCGVVDTEYTWSRRGNHNRFAVVPASAGQLPPSGSHAEFITEHYWGYTRRGPHRTDEYQVTHPQWEHYAVEEHAIEVDFGTVYGPKWAFLSAETPYSVLFARGSEIEVYPGTRLSF